MARNIKEHILQTASDLFYRQGIKATGVDAIVKATGVAKMSLYKYFPSKDDLVLAHLQRNRELILPLIRNGIAAKGSTPKQKLLAVFDVFEELHQTPGFRGCPFINASAELAEEAGPVQQAAAEFYRTFHGLLADLARQAGAADGKRLARQLAMLIAGATVGEQIQKGSGAMRIARAAAESLIDHELADAAKTSTSRGAD